MLRLGIGDTTEPIVPSVLQGLHSGVDALSKSETYSGYGPSEGITPLRQGLAGLYAERGLAIDPTEFFVMMEPNQTLQIFRGFFLKTVLWRCRTLHTPFMWIAMLYLGRTGEATELGYEGLVYMPCTEENEFFPDLPETKVDLIYICSPNNPTGAVASKEQLQKFVNYANEHRAIIFYDSAYASFITDPDLPRSIYEIDGAENCAIEFNSFSKTAGFTGVRLAWTIVPKACRTEDSEPGKLHALWTVTKIPSSMVRLTLFRQEEWQIKPKVVERLINKLLFIWKMHVSSMKD